MPEAPARGERFLVDSLHERIEALPLLVFVAHFVEGIQAPGSGRCHPLTGTWETWMAPNVVFRTILDLAAERIAQQSGAGGVSVLRVKLTSSRFPILHTAATVLLED